MKTALLAAAALTATTLGMSTPAAAIINAPVPTANYISFGGIDWAWAAPCAPYGSSCGVVDMTYQATQGWRYPTLAEFLARPSVTDFGPDASNFKCASAWFSTVHTHCDYGDPDYPNAPGGVPPMGYLFDYGYGITANGSDSVAETWVVRSIPEPASWALMIIGFGMLGTAMRRRQTVVTA